MGTARSVGITLEHTLPAGNEEAAFVGELRAGSQDAFAYLLTVYQNPVFNLVWHIVENQADASDVLQDVFVKVFKGIKGFNGDSSLKTWIYRIAFTKHRTIVGAGFGVTGASQFPWMTPNLPRPLRRQTLPPVSAALIRFLSRRRGK